MPGGKSRVHMTAKGIGRIVPQDAGIQTLQPPHVHPVGREDGGGVCIVGASGRRKCSAVKLFKQKTGPHPWSGIVMYCGLG